MPPSLRVLLTLAALVAAACHPQPRSAPSPAARDSAGPAVLRARYQALWSSVGGEVPRMVAHLGAPAGSAISVWVRADAGRGPLTRRWEITCAGGAPVRVEEEVHDARFGVSRLAVTREDAGWAPLPCTLRLGGDSAALVVPVLRPEATAGRFSFLAFSCSEPFSTTHGGGILARDLSLWLRMVQRARGEDSRGQLPERPSFVLGLGDQVYTDPDPGAPEPLAFVRGERSDDFLVHLQPDSLYGAFEVLYRYNFSLPPLAAALSRLPSYMMWDDHEIRDGWGSHGNERTNPRMEGYFRVARHAFIANQLLRASPPGSLLQKEYDSLVAGSAPLHRQFAHGERTHVLMLDARSRRAVGTPLLDASAEREVREWLARGRAGRGDLYVLGSGVPLFPGRGKVPYELHDPGHGDDLRDGWGSTENEASRARLLALLAAHFEADPLDRLLVVSGDVHTSQLFYLSLRGRVIGHEVVSSGIAHGIGRTERRFLTFLEVSSNEGDWGVQPAGKVNESASFAEVVVDPSHPDSAPRLDLVYHTNGRAHAGGWTLGNTHLLVASAEPLLYHRYEHGNSGVSSHLSRIPEGRTPAGALVPLELQPPRLHVRRPLHLWLLGRRSIVTAMGSQSVFCDVPGTAYDTTLARDWALADLSAACMRRTH